MRYVYSIRPEPEFQFLLMFILALIPFCFCFYHFLKTSKGLLSLPLAFFTLVLWVPFQCELDERKFPVLNEEMTGYLVTEKEIYFQRDSGRYGSGTSIRSSVVYRTPDGDIRFPRGDNIVYPEIAILYRNRIK